jgi:flagellar hook-associated protein 2
VANSTRNTGAPASGFTVDITSAATHGTLQGAPIGGFPLTLTGSNNELTLIIDGAESSVLSLPAKTYANGDELAREIQAQIAADPALVGRGVSVEFTGGVLTLTSSTYGSSSSVKLGAATADSAFAALGLASAASTEGEDVAGTINGESATGIGQILTGDTGNATSDGLALLVELTPGEVDSQASEAVVSIINGIAARVGDRLDALTATTDGRLANRTNTLNRQIEAYDAEVKRMEGLMESRRKTLLGDFARLEASLAVMNSQGDALMQQLSSLPRIDTFTRKSSN